MALCSVCKAEFVPLSGGTEGCPVHGIRAPLRPKRSAENIEELAQIVADSIDDIDELRACAASGIEELYKRDPDAFQDDAELHDFAGVEE